MGKILTSEDEVLTLDNKALNYENANPSIASTTSLLKGNGAGDAVAATAGIDYVAPSDLNNYIPLSQKAAANGVATLGSDSKVPSSQITLFVVSSTAPSNTNIFWIDNNNVMRYYYNGAWHVIVPTWG